MMIEPECLSISGSPLQSGVNITPLNETISEGDQAGMCPSLQCKGAGVRM